MNFRNMLIAAAAVLSWWPSAAQGELGELLQAVERNNLTLQAEGYAVEGRSREARMGNSLDPLSVSYNTAWASPQEALNTGELEVSQEFDLPMLYVTRNRKARNLAGQYESEYAGLRQQILLDAKQTYLELCAMKRLSAVVRPRLEATRHVAALYASRYETGDATAIDKNRTEMEYLAVRESVSQIDMRIIELMQKLLNLNGGIAVECDFTMPPAESLVELDRLLADWEEYDPELAVSRLKETDSEYDVRLSRQQALPKVELGYKYEYAMDENSNGFTAGLSIPIFSNRHNVKRAKAMSHAAKLNTEAAAAQMRATVTEMYQKAVYMGDLLDAFGNMPDAGDYVDMMRRTLEAGQITIVDYYSGVDTFYTTLETSIRTELEYRLCLARLNAIYM